MARTKSKVQMPAGIRNKLMAAVSMLLVSCIMLVSSTYAWFTLSTAPEVKNISTTVAGNGSLEIALMPSNGTFSDIGTGNSATGSGGSVAITTANNSWGNLITLSDASDSYGLSKITLLPATLTSSVTDGVTAVDKLHPLSTALYGYDGRIERLDANTSLKSWNVTSNLFDRDNAYGVRAIGAGTDSDFATYGYVVDLAFRLNTAQTDGTSGKLLLQTAGAQRIYSDSSNEETLGGGSYMEFNAVAGMAPNALKNLMSSIRVTFIQNYGNSSVDAEQKVIGTAKLDTSSVAAGASTAKCGLYLYSTEGQALTGNNAVLIDSMTKNAAVQVSAVVWLDGEQIKNADVAASVLQSLEGTMNLQFSTDVNLVPAVNTALKGTSTP